MNILAFLNKILYYLQRCILFISYAKNITILDLQQIIMLCYLLNLLTYSTLKFYLFYL